MSARFAGYHGTLDVLCARGEPYPTEASAWRTTTHPRPRELPSTLEIDHVALVSYADLWTSVPDDWFCPGCRRQKKHIVRKKSKGNKWSFPIAELLLFDAHGRNRSKNESVCGDCGDVAKHLGKEAVLKSGTSNHFYACHVMLSEVSEIVIPQKHGRHNINRDTVETVLNGIVERLIQQEYESNW